jgi:hypothetical protein
MTVGRTKSLQTQTTIFQKRKAGDNKAKRQRATERAKEREGREGRRKGAHIPLFPLLRRCSLSRARGLDLDTGGGGLEEEEQEEEEEERLTASAA